MNEQKFPWAIDMPVDEVEDFYKHGPIVGSDFEDYLIARLKKAESERDEILITMEDQYQSNGGLPSMLVTVLDKYRHYLEEK